jgi:hypothetical protein
VIGLKYVFEIRTSWFGCPIKGTAFGLFVGADDGDNVQKTKLVLLSVYRYLTAFCDVLVKF